MSTCSQSRRQFLRTLALGSAALAAPSFLRSSLAQNASAPVMPGSGQHPDVLFIIIEDVSAKRFGCYGSTIGKTPHVDQLAAEGLRFALSNVTCSPCNPSRTSLLLGLRPETTGVFGNATDWRTKVSSSQLTLPEVFRNNGYETMHVGKIFHDKFERAESWSYKVQQAKDPDDDGEAAAAQVSAAPASQPKTKAQRRAGRKAGSPGTQAASRKQTSAAESRQVKGPGNAVKHPGVPLVYGSSGRTDEQEHDGITASTAIALLKKKWDKPLFLAVGIGKPHLPFICPKQYMDMYRPEEMELTGPVTTDETGHMDYGTVDHKSLTPQMWREAMAAHYACLSFADAQIGKILQAVKDTGRENDMIIVFWSDHGFSLGEHGSWRKGSQYNEVTQNAFLMKVPGVTQAGAVCERPVESVDIFATLTDLCGLPRAQNVESTSMLPLMQNPDAEWKKGAIFHTSPISRTIRTEKYRLIQNSAKDEELYDEINDPEEKRNLLKDQDYETVLSELRQLLEQGWKACLPTGMRS